MQSSQAALMEEVRQLVLIWGLSHSGAFKVFKTAPDTLHRAARSRQTATRIGGGAGEARLLQPRSHVPLPRTTTDCTA